ncbi:MAG: endopeptidase La, partial [Victivallales bacterium]|nr:endopeptidase La [Victivallales bacterium]
MSKKKDITSLIVFGEDQKEVKMRVPLLTGMDSPVIPDMGIGLTLIPQDMKSARKAQKHYDDKVVMVLRKNRGLSFLKNPGRKEFYRIGVLAEVVNLEPNRPNGGGNAFFQVLRKVRLESMSNENGCIVAEVSFPKDIMPANDFEHQELSMHRDAIAQMLREVAERHDASFNEEAYRAADFLENIPYEKLPEMVCTLFPVPADDLQAVLETLNVRERMEKVHFLLRRHVIMGSMRSELMNRVTRRVEKNQRVYMLQELQRELKKELGDDIDTTENDIENFRERLAGLRDAMNPEAKKKTEEEIDKLRISNRQSPDYMVSRGYVEWLLDLPWGNSTEDKLEVATARKVLDRDHYGLEDVKKRILEFIGVSKLKGKVGGSIICLIGPPGVGKTSLGRSIAEALGRKFFRFSLGGMRDEAEIKGHRRTYIGALPGKIISALKVCGTNNPVIMLDEIDKLSSSMHGDPASALLEVLDPEQNSTFRDHFLDVPFDLSKVLFIATANVRDTIPAPLLDRMEVINISGYINEEKLAIAKKHLIPKLLPRNGLKAKNIAFTDAALRSIIDGFARDSGVRLFENAINSCMRKVAVKLAEEDAADHARISVNPAKVKELLGKPQFYDDPLVSKPRPGVAMGLAWTAAGGATLYIEVLATEAEPSLKITGQLGDVMKESAQIALSL